MLSFGLDCALQSLIAALAFGCGDGSVPLRIIYGLASFYHEPQLISDGSRYDPLGMTAASRDLKRGTRVRVTDTANGRSVMVVINDWGPHPRLRGRIIDLSLGAARKLGMERRGLISAKVEILKESP